MMLTKSGIYWVTWANAHAKNSNKISDLEVSFQNNVKAFIKALTDAGAKVEVSTTRRSNKRAYLFHWSWKISQGKCKPSDAKKMIGVDIEWDHGDIKESKAGALAMVNGFGVVRQPHCIDGSVVLPAFVARRALQGMVAPFTRSTTQPWRQAEQPFGRPCGTPPRRYSSCQGNNHYPRAVP